MTAMAATKESWQESELLQIVGDLELASPRPHVAKAEAHYEHALVVARRQKTKSWELRAAMALARLRRDQGRQHEAKEVLAPVRIWFAEGFDTPDLRAGRRAAGRAGSPLSGSRRAHEDHHRRHADAVRPGTTFPLHVTPPIRDVSADRASSGLLTSWRPTRALEEERISGFGTGPRELGSAPKLIRYLKPLIMGQDPLERERLYQAMWSRSRVPRSQRLARSISHFGTSPARWRECRSTDCSAPTAAARPPMRAPRSMIASKTMCPRRSTSRSRAGPPTRFTPRNHPGRMISRSAAPCAGRSATTIA